MMEVQRERTHSSKMLTIGEIVCTARGVYGDSVLFVQFFCNLNTLKKKVH